MGAADHKRPGMAGSASMPVIGGRPGTALAQGHRGGRAASAA